jgi:hypothetical protein
MPAAKNSAAALMPKKSCLISLTLEMSTGATQRRKQCSKATVFYINQLVISQRQPARLDAGATRRVPGAFAVPAFDEWMA